MRILFLGNDWTGSNARSMADGFASAGHDVRVVDTSPVLRPQRLSPSWLVLKTTGAPPMTAVGRFWDSVHEAVRELKPDLLFCFKTVHLPQSTLLDLGVPLSVHYSPDDVSNPVNISDDYLAHEGDWSLVVTTKSYNVPEIQARSGATASFVRSAYDPAWHHRCARRHVPTHTVGFIGNCRPDRQPLIERLVHEHGRSFLLAGEGWDRRSAPLRRHGPHRPVYGEDFSHAVARTRANLVLLNADNRDLHTCRSLEVPAAGGLVVGQRTTEHQELLVDGRECLLWDDEDELDDHLRRLEREPALAGRLALAGWRRVVSSGHSYADRAKEIAAVLEAGPSGRTP